MLSQCCLLALVVSQDEVCNRSFGCQRGSSDLPLQADLLPSSAQQSCCFVLWRELLLLSVPVALGPLSPRLCTKGFGCCQGGDFFDSTVVVDVGRDTRRVVYSLRALGGPIALYGRP